MSEKGAASVLSHSGDSQTPASSVSYVSNEVDKAIWIAAIDSIPIEERIEWTRRIRRQYDALTSSTTPEGSLEPGGDPESALLSADEAA